MTSRRALGTWLAIGGLVAALWLTCTPRPEQVSQTAETPITCIVCGPQGLADVLHNLLLFIPLAAGLRLLGWSRWRIVGAGFLLSAAIEGLQATIITGRDASLGDLLANSVSAFLGALLVDALPSLVHCSAAHARRLAAGWACVVVGIFAGTAFLQLPSRRVAQLVVPCDRPAASRLLPLRGHLLAASAQRSGTGLNTTFVAQATVSGLAGPLQTEWITGGCDSRGRPQFVIAHEWHRIVAGIRLHGDDVKLQQIVLRAPRPMEPADTVSIEIRADRHGVGIRASVGADTTAARLPMNLFTGALFFLPIPQRWLRERTAEVIAVAAAILLLVPLGFSCARGFGAILGPAIAIGGTIVIGGACMWGLESQIDVSNGMLPALIGIILGAALSVFLDRTGSNAFGTASK